MMWVLLLAAALLAASTVSAADGDKTSKPTFSPTAPPTEPFDFLYSLPDKRTFQCPHTISKNALWGTCADGTFPTRAQKIALNKPGKLKNWKTYCGLKCLERNVFGRGDITKPCIGFIRHAANSCMLYQCGMDKTEIGPGRKAPKPKGRKAFTSTLVHMDPSCFVAVPTSSPTTAAPTARPTLAHCPVTGEFGVDFARLEGAPVNLQRFTQIIPEFRLCEFIRPLSLNSNNVKIAKDFTCSVQHCVRWCASDDGCTFSMWSPVDKVCYKANNLERTDHDENFLPFWDGKYQVWKKDTITSIRYFSGRCNDLPPSVCKKEPECAWNKGKIGYNDPIQGGGAGGFCGRIKCIVADRILKKGR